MASVTISNLDKSYGNIKVLHQLDLSVEDGKFVVLLGPSGCGKSTLLRMIAGLESVTGGDILFDDVRVNDVHAKDRNIAMVFQNYALYAHMSVRKNMAFSMRLNKTDKKTMDEKVNWASSILGLDDYLDRLPKELSGGQRQRVAMGRAIVRDPDVFLFDEPLSNLDAKLRVQMRTEIKDLHQRLQTTTVYVTHDQIEAMTMADEVVVMRGGYIEQSGSPMDIYDNPNNLFVAQFIGSPTMNVLECQVAEDNGFRFGLIDETRLPLPANSELQVGQKLYYGIRPEHFQISKQDNTAGSSSSNASLTGIVRVVEPTGPEIHVYLTLAGQDTCAITRDRIELKPGDEVLLQPDLSRVHLFDAETNNAI
ncbi:MAG: sn-glycerol-3-phosphate ABC transporter ATP-binding protein UgpC [Gammaproteobacteria bacterium]|nr:sn-glycerol-3-phosphate ABC transporter ATP-binding protein UgpC [Gammaproteobacteria bacterium]